MPNDIDLTLEEIERIFNEGEVDDEQPPASADTDPQEETPPPEPQKTEEDKKKDETRAFSKRLNEEREKIAKQLGFNSYQELMKKNEEKLFTDKGLDPEEVAPIVDELVEKRLKEDPRFKELERLREKEIEEFGKRELAEVTKLTNGEITSINQLPKDVLEEWKKTGSLKTAFLAKRGEEYILKARANSSKGTTTHLQSAQGSPQPSTNTRPLTAEEKAAWRVFFPNITDEELNKKTMKVK